MKTHSLHIDPSVRDLFRENGIEDFDTLLRGDIGQTLSSSASGRQVRRLKLNARGAEETFYLKRRLGGEPAWRLLAACFFGKRPASSPVREKNLLMDLREAGFGAMEPVAWGEQRRQGIPCAGFLVVRHVEGRDAAELFDSVPRPERLELLHPLGAHIGALHRAGFLQPVRLKDLFVQKKSGDPGFHFVLIDRETAKPWRRTFRVNAGMAVLARSIRRTLRDGHALDAGCARAFLRGYAEGIDRETAGKAELVVAFVRALRSELRTGRGRR